MRLNLGINFVSGATHRLDTVNPLREEPCFFDAMRGNSARFARQDYVEQAWRIIDPILRDRVPIYEYETCTWGPPQAAALVASDGGWFDPTAER